MRCWTRWIETFSTRRAAAATFRRIVVMQRLHEEDLAGKMLRDGMAGVAEADSFLRRALPNANDLETRCGIPRNHVTAGTNAIKAALHKMSASAPAVKRVKSDAPVRAFVLSSSSSAVSVCPDARVRSHASIMAAMAAAASARAALFC